MMRFKHSLVGNFAVAGLFAMSILFTSFIPSQSEFYLIFPGISLAYLIYFYWAYNNFGSLSFKNLLCLSIGLRIFLLFSFPNLSDDVYRFIWDGKLLAHGYNPYIYLPSDIISEPEFRSFLSDNLYAELNSPGYFTVYPPVCQLIFSLPAMVGIPGITISAIIFKTCILLCELGSMFLLFRILKILRISTRALFLFALNPLILIEIMGNLHFEGMMIFFFLWFYFLLLQGKLQKSIWPLAASIGTKLLPLITVIFLMNVVDRKKIVRYYIFLGLILLFLFIPVFYAYGFMHFGESLNLYFQKFEFNASIYYLFRWLIFMLTGYNYIQIIGPFLAIMALTVIILIVIRRWKEMQIKQLPVYWLFAFVIYLFLSTTVHPWYLAMPVMLSVIAGFTFPIIWSYLVFLSYANYSYDPYYENLWIIALEYILLATVLVIEIKKPFGIDLKGSFYNDSVFYQ